VWSGYNRVFTSFFIVHDPQDIDPVGDLVPAKDKFEIQAIFAYLGSRRNPVNGSMVHECPGGPFRCGYPIPVNAIPVQLHVGEPGVRNMDSMILRLGVVEVE
jgi:hypothetical protein